MFVKPAQSPRKAIIIGGDTDTNGSIVGGLAGVWFGWENIPRNWELLIKRRDILDEIIGL